MRQAQQSEYVPLPDLAYSSILLTLRVPSILPFNQQQFKLAGGLCLVKFHGRLSVLMAQALRGPKEDKRQANRSPSMPFLVWFPKVAMVSMGIFPASRYRILIGNPLSQGLTPNTRCFRTPPPLITDVWAYVPRQLSALAGLRTSSRRSCAMQPPQSLNATARDNLPLPLSGERCQGRWISQLESSRTFPMFFCSANASRVCSPNPQDKALKKMPAPFTCFDAWWYPVPTVRFNFGGAGTMRPIHEPQESRIPFFLRRP